ILLTQERLSNNLSRSRLNGAGSVNAIEPMSTVGVTGKGRQMAKGQPVEEQPLNFSRLKEKQRSIRDDFPESLTLRVHRAISWLGRAERENDDADVRFILLWIGFNSAFGSDVSAAINSERGSFKVYFDALTRLDVDDRIYGAVWRR